MRLDDESDSFPPRTAAEKFCDRWFQRFLWIALLVVLFCLFGGVPDA